MSVNSSLNWAAVVLAAGSSSRMGRPKQLISIDDETLLQKTINAAVQAGAKRTVVVIGANQEAVRESASTADIEFIYNPEWENGMGSSLKCGMTLVIAQFPEAEAVLLMVCDQPLLEADHLKKMVDKFVATKAPIVASFYSGGNGVPVLFHQSLFHQLLTIPDEQGAKRIVEQNPALVKAVDFPNGAVDLDTPDDWKKFQNRKHKI
jgi:molybdenum cofactor cytidylyltransferase